MRRRNRRKEDIPHDNPERWLLTYADLITLLLAFFVVLYSMSRMDIKKFDRVSEALHGILKGGPSVLRVENNDNKFAGFGTLQTGNLRLLQTSLQQQIEILGRKGEVMTSMSERGLTIHIMESALFDEGKAELKPEAVRLLDLVGMDIKQMPNHVRVEGHTDDRPISTPRFPSNWELSTSRATEVVRYLIDNQNFPPKKLSALGYAQYRPYVLNNSIENRAKNRRVDIIVLTMELSAAEPASDINDFARTQIDLLRTTAQELDSLGVGNNFPF